VQAEPHSATRSIVGQRRQGWELGECVVDGEECGGVQLFNRDPVGERNLGRSVGAGRGVLLIDRCPKRTAGGTASSSCGNSDRLF
jgi:hypothetical protein